MLKYLAREQALPPTAVQSLLHGFHRDVQGEALQKEVTSPTYTHLVDAEAVMQRAARYAKNATGTSLANEVPNARSDRPKPLDNLVGMYGTAGRSRRYALGTKSYVADPEGDVELLEGVQLGGGE